MKRLTLKEAIGIAQNAVRKHLKNQQIPGDILSRLGYGAQRLDDSWLVDVVLHPGGSEDAEKGMLRDLDSPMPKTILRVRVDSSTGSSEVIEIAR